MGKMSKSPQLCVNEQPAFHVPAAAYWAYNMIQIPWTKPNVMRFRFVELYNSK